MREELLLCKLCTSLLKLQNEDFPCTVSAIIIFVTSFSLYTFSESCSSMQTPSDDFNIQTNHKTQSNTIEKYKQIKRNQA